MARPIPMLDPHALTQPPAAGQWQLVRVLGGTVLSLFLAAGGGALSGMLLAGKDLGHGLAAAMGALFGPVAATPAIFLGLIVLWLI